MLIEEQNEDQAPENTQGLNNIEPAAGDSSTPNSTGEAGQNQSEIQEIGLRPLQTVEPINLDSIDDIGPIDETERDQNNQSAGFDNNRGSAVETLLRLSEPRTAEIACPVPQTPRRNEPTPPQPQISRA